MTRFGPVHSPAGPGPRHLGSSPVWTWVRQVQDRTSDSLDTEITNEEKEKGTQVMRCKAQGCETGWVRTSIYSLS